ncbi:MAG: SdrD B-like domain-containing protein, partial [Acidimicrobiales bacterium]
GYIFTETTGSLSGTVYNDQDASGNLSPGDPGIGGVELTLTGNDSNGPVSSTTTTAPDGTYSFAGLLPGTYDITETQPGAYADASDTVGSLGGDGSTNDVLASIPVQAGENGTNYNFGESGIEISGRVYLDRNSNGIEDGVDSPLGGVVIVLLDDGGNQVAAASTAADGSYQFTELSVGDYTVQQVQPTEWGSSTPNEISFTLTGTGRSGLDFGETPGSVRGTVFADDENDGLSSGDFAVENVEVRLVDSSGVSVATALTASDGTYGFDGLPALDYTVVVSPPANSTFSPADVGSDDTLDSDVDRNNGTVVVNLGPGETRLNLDAGITPVVYDVAVDVTVPSGNYRPNDQIPFTITASNNSNVDLAGGVIVTIPLPAGSNLISAVGSGWTIRQSGTVLTAEFDGDLALGQAAPPVTVTLARPTPGTVLLPATIAIADSGFADMVEPNNASDAIVTVNAPPTIPVPSLPVTGVTTALLLAVGGFFVFSGRSLLFFADRKREDDEDDEGGTDGEDGETS